MSQLGLADLILAESTPPRLEEIPLSWIHVGDSLPPSPQLLESIRVHRRVLHPVTVNQRDDGKYDGIFGLRRILAAREVGLETVFAVVYNLPEYAPVLLTIPIVENKIRSDNAPMASEHVEALFERGADEDTISGALGISKAKVRNIRRPWTNLIAEFRPPWRDGRIKTNVAIAASKLGKAQQQRLFALFEAEGTLTARDVQREASGGMENAELPVDSNLTGWKAKVRSHAMMLEATARKEAQNDVEASSFLAKYLDVLSEYGLRAMTTPNDPTPAKKKKGKDITNAEPVTFVPPAPICSVATAIASMDGAMPDDGPCEGCGGEWLQGTHFYPEEVRQAVAERDGTTGAKKKRVKKDATATTDATPEG